MSGLIPFNRKNNNISRASTDFEDFYNMLDDFFSDGVMPGRSLIRDTFKIDIEEKENEFVIEAEVPGISKDSIDLSIDNDNLCISIKQSEETNKEGKNYVHRERRATSMSRRIHLADAKLDEIKAKLEEGILTVTVPKNIKSSASRKIDIE